MPSQASPILKASLITLSLMILGMVLIGGLTRLTGSGLSIVEWKPITGLIPPFSHKDWLLEFSKYQMSPEFQKINFGMTLGDFQSIFYLEYLHRLWGRLMGIVLVIPTFFIVFKKEYRELKYLLGALWILGLGQGLMGWVMVKSGLSHDPHVSPYRLTAHLALGFMIFGVALWMTLLVYKNKLPQNPIAIPQAVFLFLKRGSLVALSFVFFTALLGGLVAGLKAGLIYNTFPLMGDAFVPREFLTQTPWWKDLLENPVTVQFLHRLCALTTGLFCGGLWLYQRKLSLSPALSLAFNAMAIGVLLQLSLGIMTLLFGVPLLLALLHQGMAFLVFGSFIYILFLLYNRM